MISVFMLTNIYMFVLGVLVSQLLPFTTVRSSWHPEASKAINKYNGNTTTISKGTTTTMIDGLEVAETQCGQNWHEAKAMGSHFDIMASRWYALNALTKRY